MATFKSMAAGVAARSDGSPSAPGCQVPTGTERDSRPAPPAASARGRNEASGSALSLVDLIEEALAAADAERQALIVYRRAHDRRRQAEAAVRERKASRRVGLLLWTVRS